MTAVTSAPWHHPDPTPSRLRLEMVPAEVLRALASGTPTSPVPDAVSPWLAGPACRSLWRNRWAQIEATPTDAPWVTRLVVDPLVPLPVGAAGFHGAPDAAGMVEVGYRVDPEHRRRGHARRSLETMLAVADQHPDVHVVRATVSPDNTASLALVAGHGFVEVGEQWDDEDGLETIFEVAASRGRSTRWGA